MQSYLQFVKKLFSLIPFNLFDYAVIFLFITYVFEDISFGLIPAGIGFISTLLSFFIGLIFYHPFSKIILSKLSLTKGISDAAAFLIVTMTSFFIISALLSYIRRKYITLTFPKNADRIGGAIFGTLSFFFIASFAVALLLSFPISNVVKDAIRNSVTGRFLSSETQGLEGTVRQVFGGAIEDTINFLTIEPGSNSSVALNFKTGSYTIDHASENQMLKLVNIERKKQGFVPLIVDDLLQNVARDHAKDMLARGYFSHYTPEGLSPFDRMAEANVQYEYAGENLAFAPDVQIAMDGLMKSPGHRANILSPNYRRVGIGVLDAGIYGKMFVQEFTD